MLPPTKWWRQITYALKTATRVNFCWTTRPFFKKFRISYSGRRHRRRRVCWKCDRIFAWVQKLDFRESTPNRLVSTAHDEASPERFSCRRSRSSCSRCGGVWRRERRPRRRLRHRRTPRSAPSAGGGKKTKASWAFGPQHFSDGLISDGTLLLPNHHKTGAKHVKQQQPCRLWLLR